MDPAPDEDLGELTPRGRALVDAAVEIIRADGPTQVSTRRVARAAGWSGMAVFSEFGNFATLVRHVVADGFDQLNRAMEHVPTDDPHADLRAMARAYFDFALDNPNLFRTIYGVSPIGEYHRTGEDLAQGTSAFLGFAETVHRALGIAQDSHSLEPAIQLWTVGHGAAMAAITGYVETFGQDVDAYFEGVYEMALRGLGVAQADIDRSRPATD